VYVLENGRPKAVPITAGPSDGTWTQVKSGEIQQETELVTDSVAVHK
jgi:HlyD family secretion protein